MPKIKFETKYSQDQTYQFDTNKNYLIYYKGSFGPPHKDHFNRVKKVLDMGPNVKVLLNQMDGSRHGVDYHIKREIWKTYINELLDPSRVLLRSYNRFSDIMSEDLLDIDIIISIRGIEDQELSITESKIYSKNKRVGKWLKNLDVQLDFYYLYRSKSKQLSATDFTRTLIQTRGRSDRTKHNKCRYYLPDGLSYRTSLKIINQLQGLNLKV